jgi:hypothetical protein
MSEYEIGKDVEGLRRRVKELERQVEDMVEFGPCGETGSEDVRFTIEKNLGEAAGAAAGALAAAGAAPRSFTLNYGESECHAMHHKGSSLTIWENGSWESKCTLKDRSKHSKWGNWVNFYVGTGVGDVRFWITEPWAWQGNFGPGEEKVYPGRGSSGDLASHFQKLWDDELTVMRKWRCYRR